MLLNELKDLKLEAAEDEDDSSDFHLTAAEMKFAYDTLDRNEMSKDGINDLSRRMSADKGAVL